MNHLTAVEGPRGRRRRAWALDVAVVVAVAVVAAPWVVLAAAPAWLSWPAGAAMIAPLLVRRVWPGPVFVVVGLAALVDWTLGDRGTGFVVVLVALYTLAAGTGDRRATLLAGGALEAAVVAVSVGGSTPGRWVAAVFLTGMVAAAVGLGLYRATRVAYLAELRDRAVRLERERDQQGALAAAAERARIAREMHDVIAHHLTVMVALSDGAAATAAQDPARAAEVMRGVSGTGRQALADTRRLLGVLRDGTRAPGPAGPDAAGAPGVAPGGPVDGAPGPLGPQPGLDDLDDLVARVRAAGVAVRYEVRGTTADLPAGVQLTVYRLVQEALTNTLKHAGEGTTALVTLTRSPGEIRVRVVDDGGRGAPVAAAVGAGRGIAGMRERAQAFGGDVETGPRAPGGWRVDARLRTDGTLVL